MSTAPTTIESAPIAAGKRGRRTTIKSEPRREYVAGHMPLTPSRPHLRTLAWSIDDLARDFGEDIYERMQMDPVVRASLNILKSGIIETGVRLAPAVRAEHPQYDQAKDLVQWAELVLEDLEQDIDDVLWEMLDAMAVGSKMAEQVYELDQTYTGKEQLVLRRLKVKPRRAASFVVDPYMNLVGILANNAAHTASSSGVIQSSSAANGYTAILDANNPNLLPKEKFAILSFRPKDGDPRGTSIMRPSYNGWWLKMQTWAEYLKYLILFANPSLVATTAEDSLIGEDDELTAEEQLLEELLQFRNSSAIAIPYGAKVDLVFSQGNGEAFLKGFDLFNHEIVKGILHQTLATEEAQYQPRASASVHQDMLGRIIRGLKYSIQRMIRQQILRPLVRYNYGPELERLTPVVALGNTESQDFSSTATAISSLVTADYLDPSQYADLDRQLGLPERDRETLKLLLERHRERINSEIVGFQRAQEEPDPAMQGAPGGGAKPAATGGTKPARPAKE